MSHIFCIIDGMTDPFFRASDYPGLASMRLSRTVDTCRGHAPESLGCILRLLGVETVPDHLRGYAEALGAGVPVGDHDLILRGSWFAVDPEGRCTLPAPGPERLETPSGCRYHYLEQYKSLLVLEGLADCVGEIVTRPPFACAGRPAADLCPTGCPPLEALFRSCLQNGRCLIPWGQSVPASLPPFPQKAAVISGTTVVRGIARLLQMELPEVPGITGDVDTDLQAKLQASLSAARTHPFVLLHINGTDEAGHRKDLQQKQAFLRRIDGEVLQPLLRSGHAISVIADHGTDPSTGTHIAAPQPLFQSF